MLHSLCFGCRVYLASIYQPSHRFYLLFLGYLWFDCPPPLGGSILIQERSRDGRRCHLAELVDQSQIYLDLEIPIYFSGFSVTIWHSVSWSWLKDLATAQPFVGCYSCGSYLPGSLGFAFENWYPVQFRWNSSCLQASFILFQRGPHNDFDSFSWGKIWHH